MAALLARALTEIGAYSQTTQYGSGKDDNQIVSPMCNLARIIRADEQPEFFGTRNFPDCVYPFSMDSRRVVQWLQIADGAWAADA